MEVHPGALPSCPDLLSAVRDDHETVFVGNREAGREITGDPVDERRRHALPATPRRPVGERRAALAVTEGRNGEQLLLHGAHLLHHARIEVEASRSEEHTSELQSLMRISYAVFCLKKKKK